MIMQFGSEVKRSDPRKRLYNVIDFMLKCKQITVLDSMNMV